MRSSIDKLTDVAKILYDIRGPTISALNETYKSYMGSQRNDCGQIEASLVNQKI